MTSAQNEQKDCTKINTYEKTVIRLYNLLSHKTRATIQFYGQYKFIMYLIRQFQWTDSQYWVTKDNISILKYSMAIKANHSHIKYHFP